jgi:hypothetical protein
MSDELWVVRAGEKAKFVDEFLARSQVAISFVDFLGADLSTLNEAAVKSRVSSPAEQSYAGQLIAFAYRMQVGDIVIVPRLTTRHRDYLVARIASPYQHLQAADASGPHQRAVQWLGRFERESLSKDARHSLGSISTVFRPAAVEAELRDLLTALLPIEGDGVEVAAPRPRTQPGAAAEAGSAVNVVPVPHALPPAQLDIEIDSEGRARVNCAHPALAMEQTARHIDPGTDWAGVPGIYVLTGTELQQSSMRTGNERTLTTTLIVKPWAYVGLSEDFLGRIGSHRQSKQEWRRALLVRSAAQPFSSDDIKYLEQRVHAVLQDTGEVLLGQSTPRGNLSARPRSPGMLDACADTIVAVLRLTGTLI